LNFILIPVLGLILYPFIPEDQRRGVYRVYFIICGVTVAALLVMLVIKLVLVLRDRERTRHPPGS